MRSDHLTSADLARAAEAGGLDAGARRHLETCSRCRARYGSAVRSYGTIAGALRARSSDVRGLADSVGRIAEVERASRPTLEFAHLLSRERRSPGDPAHLSEDRLLALATDAAPAHDAREWRRHIEECPRCRARAEEVRAYAPRSRAAEETATRPSAPTDRRAGISIARSPGGPKLLLTLRLEGAPSLADPRPEVVLPCRGAFLHLFASVDASGSARLDVDVEPRGASPEGIDVALRAASGRIAKARTGRLGRATLPLEPGRSTLTVATAPEWQVEIDAAWA